MEILIISGLSGGGKSQAASFLEDMGYYIVGQYARGHHFKVRRVLRRVQGAV